MATTPNAGAIEAAIPAGEDPARWADLLARVREAALAGRRGPALPRPVIDDSWERVLRAGVDPDVGRDLPAPVGADEVETRRRGGPLGRLVPVLSDVLLPAAEDAGHVMVVVDRDGTVLWRDGPDGVQRRAESLGFGAGADWSESAVGTNAIGTALVVDRPVQVYSAEHFVRSHHDWTCAAAPIHDPASGELLGVVDVSGAADTVHPSTLALVRAAARVAEEHLRTDHQRRLGGLRALAAPLLARGGSRALVTDEHGWVAAAVGMAAPERILLPTARRDRALVPTLGVCRFEPVPGGWFVRPAASAPDADVATVAELDLAVARPVLRVRASTGEFEHRLSPRHAELLCVLAAHRDGRSAAQLSVDLFGEPGHEVTVRADTSRLRRVLGDVVAPRPYRFADWLQVTVRWPADRAALLPGSVAPAVRGLRGRPG